MPKFDLQGARSSGATDEQILSFIKTKVPEFDIEGALKFQADSGDTNAIGSVVEFLNSKGMFDSKAKVKEESYKPYVSIFNEAANEFGVDAFQTLAMAKQESGFKPTAKSPVGARGMMQIMPNTAKEIAAELGIADYDLNDPRTNIRFGTYYYKKLLDMFDGDQEKAWAAYNGGARDVKTAVTRAGDNWKQEIARMKKPHHAKENLGYIDSVGKHLRGFEQAFTTTPTPPATPEAPVEPSEPVSVLEASKSAVVEEEAVSPASERFTQPEDITTDIPVDENMSAMEKLIGRLSGTIGTMTGSIALKGGKKQLKMAEKKTASLEDLNRIREKYNLDDIPQFEQPDYDTIDSKDKRLVSVYMDRRDEVGFKESVKQEASELKEAGEFNIAVGKELITDELNKLADIYVDDAEKANEGMFTFVKKAWTRGDLSDAIAQGIGRATMFEDYDLVKRLRDLKDQVDKELAPEEEQGFFTKVADSLIGMMPYMGKRAALSTIPVVGAGAAYEASAMQGAGDVMDELLKAGATPDMARKLSLSAGLVYGAIEKMQLDELANFTNTQISAVKGKAVQYLIDFAKKRGVATLKEVGEEGLQALITNSAIEVGKEVEDLDDATIGDRISTVAKKTGEEMLQALFTFGILEGGKAAISTAGRKIVSKVGEKDAEEVRAEPQEAVQEEITVEEGVQQDGVRDVEEGISEEKQEELASDVATMSAEEIARSNDLETIELLKDEIPTEVYEEARDIIQKEEVVSDEAQDIEEKVPTEERVQEISEEVEAIESQEIDEKDFNKQESVKDSAIEIIDQEIKSEALDPAEIFIRESRPLKALELVKSRMDDEAYTIAKGSMQALAKMARDGATGLQGRAAMVSGIVEAMDYVNDGKLEDFSVVLTDMSNLGGANTRFTHEGANDVLKAIAGNIKTGIDNATKDMPDVFTEVYRPGGDEFAAAFVGLDENNIKEIMNQVQADNDSYVKTATFKNPATGETLPLADMPHEKKAGLPVDIGGVSYGVVTFKDFQSKQGEDFEKMSKHDQVAKFLSYADQLQAIQANERIIRKVAETKGFDAMVADDDTIKVFKIKDDKDKKVTTDAIKVEDDRIIVSDEVVQPKGEEVEDAITKETEQKQEKARQPKQDARTEEQRVPRDQAEGEQVVGELKDSNEKQLSEISELKKQIAELQDIVKTSTKDIAEAIAKRDAVVEEEAVQEEEAVEPSIAVSDVLKVPTPASPVSTEVKSIKAPSGLVTVNETNMTPRQVADLEEFAESGNFNIDDRGMDYYVFSDENGINFQVDSDDVSNALSIYEDAIKEYNKNQKYINTKNIFDQIEAELSDEVLPEYKSAGQDLGSILSNMDKILSAEKAIREYEGKPIPYRPSTYQSMDSLDTFINDFKKERRSESTDYKRLRRVAFDDGQYEALWSISKKFGKRGWPILTEEEASALSKAELLPAAASKKVSLIDSIEAGGVIFDPKNRDMVRYLKNGQVAINAEGELELTSVNPELYRTDQGERIVIEQLPDKTVQYVAFSPETEDVTAIPYEDLIFMNSVPPNKASKPSGVEIRELEVSGRKKTQFVSDEVSLDANTTGSNSFDDFDMELQSDMGQSFIEDSRFDEEDEDLSDQEIADSYDHDEYYGTDGAFYNRSKRKESSNGKYSVTESSDGSIDIIIPSQEIVKHSEKFSDFLYYIEELIDTGVLDWDTEGIETAEDLSDSVVYAISSESDDGISLRNVRNLLSSIHNTSVQSYIDKKQYLESMRAITDFEDIIDNLAPTRKDNKRRVLSSIESARRSGDISNDNAAWMYSILSGVDDENVSFDMNFSEKEEFANDGVMGYFNSADDLVSVSKASTNNFTHELSHFLFYRALTGKERYQFYKDMSDRYWPKGKYNVKQMKADLVNAGTMGKSSFEVNGETFIPRSDYDYLTGNFSEFFAELVSRRIHELSGLQTREDLSVEEARILSDSVNDRTMSLIDKVIEWIKNIYKNLTGALDINKYSQKYLDKLYNIDRASNISYDMIVMTDEELAAVAKDVRPFSDNNWHNKASMLAKSYVHANKLKKIKAPESKSKPLIKMARSMRNKDIVKKSNNIGDVKKAIVAYTYDAITSDSQRKAFLKNATKINSINDKYHLRAIEMMESRDETAIRNRLLIDVKSLIRNGLKSTSGDAYNAISREYFTKYNLSRLTKSKSDKFKEEINARQKELEALKTVKWFDKLTEQQEARIKKLENENLSDLDIDTLEEMFNVLSEQALSDIATAKEARNKAKNDMQIRKESADEIVSVLKNYSKRFETYTALINSEVYKKSNIINKGFSTLKQFSGKTLTMYSSSVANLETILDLMDDEYKRAVIKYNETHPDKPKSFARYSLNDLIAKEVIDADKAAIEFEDSTMSYFISEFKKLGFDAQDMTLAANTSVYDIIRSFGNTKKLAGVKTFKLGEKADVKLTSAERISLFLTANDPDGLAHLVNGGFYLGKDQQTRYTPTITELDKITDLDDKELKVARVIESYFNGHQKTRLNDWSRDYLGYSIASNENYFPLTVKGTEVQKGDKYILEDKKSGQVGIATPGALLARRGDKTQGLLISDAFEVIAQSSEDTGRYTSYAGRLAKVKTVLNSIQKKLVESGRHTQFKNVNEMIDRIATKDRWAGSGALARTLYQKLPAVYARGVLGFKVAVSLLQTVSGTNYMQMPWSNLKDMVGLKDFNSRAMLDEMAAHSPLSKYRILGNIERDVNQSSRAATAKYIATGGKRNKGLRRYLNPEVGMSPITLMDIYAITGIWSANKRSVDREGELEVDSREYWDEVTRRHEMTIRHTQPEFNLSSRGTLTSNPYLKPFTMFSSQLSKNFMMNLRAINDIKNGNIQRGFSKLFLLTVIQPLMIMTIRRAWESIMDEGFTPDAIDDFIKDIMKDIGSGKLPGDWAMVVAGQLVGLGPFIQTAFGTFGGEFGGAAEEIYTSLVRGIKHLVKVAKGDEDPDPRTIRKSGVGLGIPMDGVYQINKAVNKTLEGYIE